jgi:hypothetical protein
VDVKQNACHQHPRRVRTEPKGRDFTRQTQAPGANIEKKLGGLSIDLTAAENKYVIDGIDEQPARRHVRERPATDFSRRCRRSSAMAECWYPRRRRQRLKGGTNDSRLAGATTPATRSATLADRAGRQQRNPAYGDGRRVPRRPDRPTRASTPYDDDGVDQTPGRSAAARQGQALVLRRLQPEPALDDRWSSWSPTARSRAARRTS